MSFLLQQAINSQEADPEKIKLAEIQFEAMNSTFNNLLKSCAKKCIPDEFVEGDLNKGEMVCLDRCVAKFYKANMKIGEFVQGQGLGPEKLVAYNRFAQR